jgi:hypothetical protein
MAIGNGAGTTPDRRDATKGNVMKIHETLVGACLVLCGLWTPGSAAGQGIHLGIVPLEAVVAPGDTFQVDLTITEAGAQFNAFDIYLGFDPERVAFVPTVPQYWQYGPLMTDACGTMFPVFEPQAAQLRITLSLLCANTFVTGPGVVYRVKFRALPGSGEAAFTCNTGTQFYRAGFFVNPLECVPGSVTVGEFVGIDEGGDIGAMGWRLAAPAPNPARGWGIVGFTVPRAGSARLELYDVSGRLVAARPERRFEAAGRYAESWDVSAVPSGVYVVRLVASSGETATTRWTLVR